MVTTRIGTPQPFQADNDAQFRDNLRRRAGPARRESPEAGVAGRSRLSSAPRNEDEGGGRADRLRKLLDGRTHWYAIDALAAQVPTEFVRSLWPVLNAVVSHLGDTMLGYRIEYDDNGLWCAKLDRRDFDSPDELTQALEAAIPAFARTEPVGFAAFARDSGNPDSMLLQRLVCRGVREVAAANPTLAVEFLTGDPRRFLRGGLHDDQGDSVELIESAGPRLSAGQVTRPARAVPGLAGVPASGERAGRRGRRLRAGGTLPSARGVAVRGPSGRRATPARRGPVGGARTHAGRAATPRVRGARNRQPRVPRRDGVPGGRRHPRAVRPAARRDRLPRPCG